MVYFSVTFLCTAGLFLALLEDRYRLWTTVAATVVVYGLALGLAYPIRQLITDPVWGDQVACGAGALHVPVPLYRQHPAKAVRGAALPV